MQIKAILFDFDRTLANTVDLIIATLLDVYVTEEN